MIPAPSRPSHCPPEEYAERVYIDGVVVVAGEQLRRHVDGRAHDAARHHRLRLAEPKVRQLAAVTLVQLGRGRGGVWW